MLTFVVIQQGPMCAKYKNHLQTYQQAALSVSLLWNDISAYPSVHFLQFYNKDTYGQTSVVAVA